jgi:hypothetical protein
LATSGYAFKDIEEVVTTRVFAETIEETRSVTLVAPKIIEETPTVTQAPAKKSYWDMIMGVLIAVRDAFASSITSLTKLFK